MAVRKSPISIVIILRKITVVILMVALVLTASTTILVYSLRSGLLDFQNWQVMMDQTRIAERSRPLLANFLVSYLISSNLGYSFVGDFPMKTWEGVAERIIPISWMEGNLEMAIKNILSWFQNDQENLPDLSLDLFSIREALNSSEGALAVLPLMQDIQACPKGTVVVEYFVGGVISCLPGSYDLTHFADTAAHAIADGLPERISIEMLNEFGYLDSSIQAKIGKVRLAEKATNKATILGFRFSLLLLSLYALLHSMSLNRFLRSLPLPFYGIGGFSLLFILGWQAFLQWVLGLAILLALPNVGIEIQALAADLLHSISQIVTGVWLQMAFVCLGLGIFIHVLGFGYTKLKQHLDASHTQAPTQAFQIRKSFR